MAARRAGRGSRLLDRPHRRRARGHRLHHLGQRRGLLVRGHRPGRAPPLLRHRLRDGGARQETAPDIYRLALSALGLSPAEDAIAFEISANGLAMTRAAGIFTVVTPTLDPLPGLRRGGPHLPHMGDPGHTAHGRGRRGRAAPSSRSKASRRCTAARAGPPGGDRRRQADPHRRDPPTITQFFLAEQRKTPARPRVHRRSSTASARLQAHRQRHRGGGRSRARSGRRAPATCRARRTSSSPTRSSCAPTSGAATSRASSPRSARRPAASRPLPRGRYLVYDPLDGSSGALRRVNVSVGSIFSACAAPTA